MSNRNATASWSGYSHQGQVGLLVALREMRSLMLANLQNEFDFHFVEYENNEDVAISKQLANTPKELISVHQVKAYYSQGHLINTYKSVFIKNEEFKKNNEDEYILDENGEKIQLDDYVDDQWGSTNNYLHTSREITNWSNNYFEGIGGNPFKVERFPYSDIKFHCGTDEIGEFIIGELNSQDFHNGNNGASIMTLNRLSFKLDEKIREEHATKEGKSDYDIKFSFREILNIVNDTINVDSNDIFISRKSFFDEFIYMIINQNVEADIEHIEFLKSNIIQHLYNLEDSNFLNFLMKLNLNESQQKLKTSHYNFNAPGIKQVFLKILIKVKNQLPQIIDNSIQYKNLQKNSKYVLTAIIEEEDCKEIVISNILDNLNSQNILWEDHALINKEISANFIENIPKINNIITPNIDGVESDKFMSFTSKSCLIKREEAINILQNDTTT